MTTACPNFNRVEQTNLFSNTLFIVFLFMTFEFWNGVLHLFDKLLCWKLQHRANISFIVCIWVTCKWDPVHLKWKQHNMKQPTDEHWAETSGHIYKGKLTCKFSRLNMSPTARFCLITLVIFSFWLSRYSFTAFGLDRDVNCCSLSFIFACVTQKQS